MLQYTTKAASALFRPACPVYNHVPRNLYLVISLARRRYQSTMQRNTYDPAALLDPTNHTPDAKTPRILIILNAPLEDYDMLEQAWQACEIRICADGGANRLYDFLRRRRRRRRTEEKRKGYDISSRNRQSETQDWEDNGLAPIGRVEDVDRLVSRLQFHHILLVSIWNKTCYDAARNP